MSHKKIMKSCEKKLMKDAKHYEEEKKEAMGAAKAMKKKAKKAKD